MRSRATWAASALVLAGAAMLAAKLHQPPPRTEWLAVALWAASIASFAFAARSPPEVRVWRHELDWRDLAALSALLLLGACLLLPYLAVYPLEIASDPPRDSGVLTASVAISDAPIFQYGYFNGFSFVMPATGVPFYLLFGNHALTFKGLAAAIGIATPLLLYLLGRRYLPRSHAAAAAAIMLTLPAYMFYARREPIHAYNPFWMVVLLGAVMKVEDEESKPRTFALLGLVAGLTVHFHAAVKAAGFAALGICAMVALARTVTAKQSWRRLVAGGVAAVTGFLVGLGPLLLVSDFGLLFSSGRLGFGGGLEPGVVLARYLHSLRVFFDYPAMSWFPTHMPLIPSNPLRVLFVLGAVLGFVAVPLRLQLTLLTFVLVLPLTNSALTDIVNGDHRLSPLFPVLGLLIATGLAVLRRATNRFRPRAVRATIQAAFLLGAALAAARPVKAFFTEEQARPRDRFSAFLVHQALHEIERDPMLDRAPALCMGGAPWLEQELQLGHYRDGFRFYRSGQAIRATEYDGAEMNEIFVSASCLPFDGGAEWSTRTACSPRQRFVCPGAEAGSGPLVIHVDHRPPRPVEEGGAPEPAAGTASRRTLPDGRAVRGGGRSVDGLERIDLAALRRSGAVEITVNDPTFVPHLDGIFDGDSAWPSHSDGINPLVIELKLAQPIRLASARVFLAGSTYDWAVETRPGERWSRTATPPDQWSQIDLRAPEETTTVRIEMLRLERDDNVHLSEIELYAVPP